MSEESADQITESLEKFTKKIDAAFISPNVMDSNGEAANIVDTTQFIANGIVKGACIIAAAIVVHREGAEDPVEVIRVMANEIRSGRLNL